NSPVSESVGVLSGALNLCETSREGKGSHDELVDHSLGQALQQNDPPIEAS
ncbi:hypothetical protein Pmar_PMAR008125, partial [Perkinsus marinus ATCC 50983]